jgi:hypothetical protein
VDGADHVTEEQGSSIDGHPTRHIRASTLFGSYEFWLDPNADFMPRRMVITQEVTSIGITGKAIGAPLPPLPVGAKTPPMPYVPKKSTEIVVDAIDLETFKGKSVPVAYRIVQTTEFVDGRSVRSQSEFKCTSFEFDPDFNAVKAFLCDLPDGVRVFNAEASAVGYEIRGGKVVPRIDPLIVKSIDKTVAENQGGNIDNHAGIATQGLAVGPLVPAQERSRHWIYWLIFGLFSLLIITSVLIVFGRKMLVSRDSTG